jgi:hypothetical protein
MDRDRTWIELAASAAHQREKHEPMNDATESDPKGDHAVLAGPPMVSF